MVIQNMLGYWLYATHKNIFIFGSKTRASQLNTIKNNKPCAYSLKICNKPCAYSLKICKKTE